MVSEKELTGRLMWYVRQPSSMSILTRRIGSIGLIEYKEAPLYFPIITSLGCTPFFFNFCVWRATYEVVSRLAAGGSVDQMKMRHVSGHAASPVVSEAKRCNVRRTRYAPKEGKEGKSKSKM